MNVHELIILLQVYRGSLHYCPEGTYEGALAMLIEAGLVEVHRDRHFVSFKGSALVHKMLELT